MRSEEKQEALSEETQADIVTKEVLKKEHADKERKASHAAAQSGATKPKAAIEKEEKKEAQKTEDSAPKKKSTPKKKEAAPKDKKPIIFKGRDLSKVKGTIHEPQPKTEEKEMKTSSKKEKKSGKKEKAARNPYAGKSIKVLDKTNPYREGSDRAIRFNIIIASKNVDDAMGKTIKGQNVSARDISRAVKKHLIKLI